MLSIHNWGFDFLCNTDSRVTLTLFKNNIDYKLCKVKVDRDSDYDISKIFFLQINTVLHVYKYTYMA